MDDKGCLRFIWEGRFSRGKKEIWWWKLIYFAWSTTRTWWTAASLYRHFLMDSANRAVRCRAEDWRLASSPGGQLGDDGGWGGSKEAEGRGAPQCLLSSPGNWMNDSILESVGDERGKGASFTTQKTEVGRASHRFSDTIFDAIHLVRYPLDYLFLRKIGNFLGFSGFCSKQWRI